MFTELTEAQHANVCGYFVYVDKVEIPPMAQFLVLWVGKECVLKLQDNQGSIDISA